MTKSMLMFYYFVLLIQLYNNIVSRISSKMMVISNSSINYGCISCLHFKYVWEFWIIHLNMEWPFKAALVNKLYYYKMYVNISIVNKCTCRSLLMNYWLIAIILDIMYPYVNRWTPCWSRDRQLLKAWFGKYCSMLQKIQC